MMVIILIMRIMIISIVVIIIITISAKRAHTSAKAVTDAIEIFTLEKLH